jgi:hypothetical protein
LKLVPELKNILHRTCVVHSINLCIVGALKVLDSPVRDDDGKEEKTSFMANASAVVAHFHRSVLHSDRLKQLVSASVRRAHARTCNALSLVA